MPKKKTAKEKEEEARRLEEEERERETNEVIKEVLEDLLHRTETKVYEKYIQEKAVERATRTALDNTILSLEAVHLDFYKYNASEDTSWNIDKEPECPPIDTWARSAIRVKKRSELRKKDVPLKFPRFQRGVKLFRTIAKESKLRSASHFARLQTPKLPAHRVETATRNEDSDSEDESPETTFEAMQRIALEEMRRLQKELDDEDQRFERTATELKGKSYTYDREGNVVMIKPISKKKVNRPISPKTEIRGVRDDTMNDEELSLHRTAPAAIRSSKRGGGRRGGRRKGGSRHARTITSVVTESSKNDQYFQGEPYEQPPLTSTMRLSSGVSVREGARKRDGPRLESTSPMHMSRNDFLKHQDSLLDEMMSTMSRDLNAGDNDRATTQHSQMSDWSMLSGSAMTKDLDIFEGSQVVDEFDNGDDNDEEERIALDEHQLLATAEDWGTNPPSTREFVPREPVPHNSSKHTLQTLGQRSRKPRDRHDFSPPVRRRLRRPSSSHDDGNNDHDNTDDMKRRQPLSPASTLTSSRKEALERYFSPLPGGKITRSIRSVPGLY